MILHKLVFRGRTTARKRRREEGLQWARPVGLAASKQCARFLSDVINPPFAKLCSRLAEEILTSTKRLASQCLASLLSCARSSSGAQQPLRVMPLHASPASPIPSFQARVSLSRLMRVVVCACSTHKALSCHLASFSCNLTLYRRLPRQRRGLPGPGLARRVGQARRGVDVLQRAGHWQLLRARRPPGPGL